jgi:hypothetical protein
VKKVRIEPDVKGSGGVPRPLLDKYIEKHGVLARAYKAFEAADILNPIRAMGFRSMVEDSRDVTLAGEYAHLEPLYALACESLPGLYSVTRQEMAGLFTHEELEHILYALKDKELPFLFVGKHVAAFSQETPTHVYPATRSGELLRRNLAVRIDGLSMFEKAVLEMWVWVFWKYNPEATREDAVKRCETFGRGFAPLPPFPSREEDNQGND